MELYFFLDTVHNLVVGVWGNIFVDGGNFVNVIDDASLNPFGETIREVGGRSSHRAYKCSEVNGVYASESKASVRYRKGDSFVKVRKQLKLIVKSLLVINAVVRSN